MIEQSMRIRRHPAGVTILPGFDKASNPSASMDRAGACIATYGSNPPVLDALAAVLLGNVEARGSLPVELS